MINGTNVTVVVREFMTANKVSIACFVVVIFLRMLICITFGYYF